MAIAIRCGQCEWSGRAKDELAGRRVKCPKCAASILVVTGEASAQASAPPTSAPPAPAASPNPASPPLSPEEAAALVGGRIEPVRTTLGYRLALALVAMAMVLLPMAYLATIAGVIWGVWWHLVNHAGMLTGHGLRGKAALMPVIAYLAPAVIGAVMVLFLVKPLLARGARESDPRSLKPEDEPTLFAFVAAICRAVGAPLPKRIDVDMQVNASASHRRGLMSLAGGDLVLTIGLPLAAGMSVEQFAGILAHEFGHFTQGAGMGFGALIDRINSWFARVVWQRDAWDERLEEWSKSVDLRIGWILWLARGCVWLTRKMLFGLMWVAHALSCRLSRHMEYDADLHQVRLVGSATFVESFQRLPVLATAENGAWRSLHDAWVEGVTADSIPELVVLSAERLTADELAEIERHTATEKAGTFDTHPTTRDRIERATALRSPSLLACRDPAARLFADFARLCGDVTRAIHEQVHLGKASATQVLPAKEIIARSGAEQEAARAAARWLDDETSPFLPFPGKGGPLEASAGECVAALDDARTTLDATPATPRDDWEAIFAPLERHQHTTLVASFVATGKPYQDRHGGQTLKTPEDVERIRREAWSEFRARCAPLVERRKITDRRLRAALGWLASTDAASRLRDAAARRAEVAAFSRALAALEARRVEWTAVVAEFEAAGFWVNNVGDEDLRDSAQQAIGPAFARTSAGINSLRESLLEEPYPLGHADPTMTIGRYLVPEPTAAENPEAVWEAAERLRSLFPWLAWQLVGRLALHAEAVEAALDRGSAPAR